MAIAVEGSLKRNIRFVIAHHRRDGNVGIQTVVLVGIGAVLGANPVGKGLPVGITGYPVGFGFSAFS